MKMFKSKSRLVIFLTVLLCVMTTLATRAENKERASYEPYSISRASLSEGVTLTVEMSDARYRVLYGGGWNEFDNLQLALDSVADGCAIRFVNVKSDSGLVVTGDITLSGELTLGGNLYVSSSALTLSDLSLTLEGSSLCIKGGSVTMTGGKIASDKDAVVLDYSVMDSFTQKGGIIQSEKTGVVLSKGHARILGGEIYSGEYAIKSSSTLMLASAALSGEIYDLSISEPLIAEDSGCSVKGLSILADMDIRRGKSTPVILNAHSTEHDGLKVYSNAGEEYEPRLISECYGVSERNFISVHLPYILSLYDESRLLARYEYLEGEPTSRPVDPERTGYGFLGWYLDVTGNTPYTFSQSLSRDTNIFAAFSLLPPTYEIQPLNLTYDGKEHFVSIDSPAHPLMSEGSFSYEWYKNGEPQNMPSDRIAVRSVADSGAYKCKITFAYMGDFVSVTTPEVSVNIEKMKVALPSNIRTEYNGAYQSPPPATELYTQKTLSFINVGAYTVEIELTDKENCVFEGTMSYEASFIFEITRAKNFFISLPEVGPAFVGVPPTVSSRAAFGVAYTEYFVSGEWSRDYPRAVGEYMLRAVVAPSENFEGAISAPVSFEVREDVCIGISVDTPPKKAEYFAFDKLELEGAVIYAVYTSGTRRLIQGTELAVKYKQGDSLRVFDSSVTLLLGEVSVPLAVSVKPREYDVSGVRLEECELIYSQSRQCPSVVCDVIGLDGIPLTYTVRGGGVDVGEYTAYIDFATDSFNYKLPPTLELPFRILPLEIIPVFENTRFTYDKSAKVPSAYITTPMGERIELAVTGAATYAGEYRAEAISPSANYVLKSASCDFVIERARLDLSSVKWSGEVFDYNGTAHSVTLEGLPDGVSVIGYAGRSATEAGEYTATATLYFDERNYISEGVLTHKYTVRPIYYDFSDFVFLDTTLTYDGDEKYPELRGRLPVGYDGSMPTVAFEGAPTDVAQGVSVKITLISTSKNYLTSEPIYRTVTVLPKQIEVIWSGGDVVYDGRVKTPYAHSAECEIRVTGGGVNAGRYIATATPLSKNYTVINPTLIFNILKMKNSFTEQPSIVGGYEGDAPKPIGGVKYGQIAFSYYTDITLSSEAPLPLSYGSYYMVARADEGENYEGIVSSPIPFTVKQILPISIEARLKSTSLVAFSRLTDADIEVFLKNNNGSTTVLSYPSFTVAYQNGDSLRARDTEVSITAGDFSCKLSVKVALATYDTSGVRWTVTHAVYNGGSIQSLLTGLPEGVSVREYICNRGTDAGNYPLLASLEYDSENYNPPYIKEQLLTIEKRCITLPDDISHIYDGEVRVLDVPSCEYYIGGSLSASSVGRYLLSVNLYDTKNYKTDREGVTLTVIPRGITLEVTDKYGSYKCVGGSIIQGDELGITVDEKEGFVYVSIQNSNYVAKIIPFDTSKTSDNIWILLLIILIALILSFSLYVLYVRRDAVLVGVRTLIGSLKGGQRQSAYKAQCLPTPTALLSTDAKYADTAISNYLAKSLVRKGREKIYTEGRGRETVYLADISGAFSSSDRIDINALKEKGLIPKDTSYIRIEGGGVLDKALHIIADSFSPVAVKMIALTGGTSTRSRTRVKRKR